MSSTLLRNIIVFILLFHGIGHIMGVISALRIITITESSPSWVKEWSSDS